MIKNILLSLFLIGTLVQADPFSKGNLGLGVVLGSGSITIEKRFSSEVQNYTILGVSTDYFIYDNLSVGIGYRGWFGGEPTLNQFTIPVTYYAPLSEKFRPYIGVFGRQTLVNSDIYDDYSSYGAKIGVAYLFSPRAYLGFGWVTEKYSECDMSNECSNSYPEFVFSFSL